VAPADGDASVVCSPDSEWGTLQLIPQGSDHVCRLETHLDTVNQDCNFLDQVSHGRYGRLKDRRVAIFNEIKQPPILRVDNGEPFGLLIEQVELTFGLNQQRTVRVSQRDYGLYILVGHRR
jgi:hypothetical protein